MNVQNWNTEGFNYLTCDYENLLKNLREQTVWWKRAQTRICTKMFLEFRDELSILNLSLILTEHGCHHAGGNRKTMLCCEMLT